MLQALSSSRVEFRLDQGVESIFGAKVLQYPNVSRYHIGGEGTTSKRTGMPEFVLIPAPVMTTTLRALSRALATSWSSSWELESTRRVGILAIGLGKKKTTFVEKNRAVAAGADAKRTSGRWRIPRVTAPQVLPESVTARGKCAWQSSSCLTRARRS